MATLATLRGYCQRDTQTTDGVYISTADWDAYLNEGAHQFCRETRILRTTTTIQVAGGDFTPSIASVTPKILEVLKVWWDGEELDMVTEQWLQANFRNYLTDQGTPKRYVRFDTGFPEIRLHPGPTDTLATSVVGGAFASSPYGVITNITGLGTAAATSAYGTTTNVAYLAAGMRVDYVADCADMTTSGSSPDFDPQFHLATYYYAMKSFHKRYDIPIAEPEKIAEFEGLWANEVSKAIRLVSSEFQKQPAMARRGRPIEWS